MSQRDAFISIVSLYRGLNRPAIQDNHFQFQGRLDGARRALAQQAWSIARADIADIRISSATRSASTSLDDEFPLAIAENDEVEILVGIPSGQFQFKAGLDEYLLSTNDLNTASQVTDVYLAEEDHLFGENVKNKRIESALRLSEMIHMLRRISDHCDLINASSTWKIVFIVPSEHGDRHKPIVLEPKITPNLVDMHAPDLAILENLTRNTDDAHNEEKASIFRVSMFEIFQRAQRGQDNFYYLLAHWQDLINSYRKNYELYVSKFSFIRQKKIVTAEYINLYEKISGSLSSITTQLFGLPISIAVVYVVYKATSVGESTLLVLGALLASLILAQIIREQQRIRLVLSNSIGDAFDSTANNYSQNDELHALINGYRDRLRKQAGYVGKCLFSFRVLAWTPVIFAAAIFWIRFTPEFWLLFWSTAVAALLAFFAMKALSCVNDREHVAASKQSAGQPQDS